MTPENLTAMREQWKKAYPYCANDDVSIADWWIKKITQALAERDEEIVKMIEEMKTEYPLAPKGKRLLGSQECVNLYNQGLEASITAIKSQGIV